MKRRTARPALTEAESAAIVEYWRTQRDNTMKTIAAHFNVSLGQVDKALNEFLSKKK